MNNVSLLTGVIIILGGVAWFLFQSIEVAEAPVFMDRVSDEPVIPDNQNELPVASGTVRSFAECVAAGNLVMESSPRQCRHDGVTYREEVELPPEEELVACTMDAKLCPDGSAVGRVGPDCAFAPCPAEQPAETVTCSPAAKQVAGCDDVYAPVCGLVEVQCVTTPCNPVPETFANGCYACAAGNVISYTAGACSL